MIPPSLSIARALCVLGLLIAAVDPSRAADAQAPSRKCRATVAKQALKLTTLGLRSLDACLSQRARGKRTAACLPLAAADPKGRLGRTRARAEAAIDKGCVPGDAVRGNFPDGQIAQAVLPYLETRLAESAAALQGSTALAGDKQAARCHAAIGKARSAIVATIVTRSLRCQKALDRKATTFGPLADPCVLDAGKAATKAAARIATACRRKGGAPIAGAEVGSCDALPACVVAAATATGQDIARAVYARADTCGDGLRTPGERCPRLEGAPDEPALAAIATVDLEPGVPLSEVEVTPEGARLARTRLDVELTPAATVAGVNALLDNLEASILMAVANVPLLVLRLPDPGSIAALQTVLALACAHPAVHAATAGFFAEPDLLPDNFDPAQAGGADLTKIDHLLAVRAPAAWNARGALPPLGERPLVVVGDLFGDGPPDTAMDLGGIVASDFATGTLYPNGHGYHVLGIVAAAFGGSPCTLAPLTAPVGRACATGMFPGTLPVRVVDLQAGLSTLGARVRMIQRLLFAGKAVLSTSLNDCGVGTCGNPLVAAEQGRQWVLLMRGAGLEDDVLHLTSAGNINVVATPTVTDALTNSAFTAAALFDGGLFDPLGNPLPTLGNVLVVENARNTAGEPYAPRCLDPSSKRGGHLTGIGTNVWSLRDAAGVTGFCGFSGRCVQDASGTSPTACTPGNSAPCQAIDKTGTSMATPQVAALAAYLWALDPGLSVAELRALLLATAVPTGNDGGANPCDAAAPKPVIDAYAAVLALDRTATPPSPESAPMRRAILDADGDGTFDETDLGLFLERYFQGFVDAGTHGPAVTPASRDYGRFDLNGDGFTGGPARLPFDLDLVGSPPLAPPVLGRVFQPLDEGGGVFFEDAGLTDLDILCYYAYSALYQGTPAGRDARLDRAWCNPVEVFASFVGFEEEHLIEGEPALLRVTVAYRDAGGVARPLPGVHVEIALGGGSGGGSGTTDEAGRVEQFVTPGRGSEEVEITVRARPAAGGVLLAETSQRASVDDDDDDEPEDECEDFRPDGVYLEKRSSLAAGNTIAYYFPTPAGSSTFIYLLDSYPGSPADSLRKRTDLPGASIDRYFGLWTGSAARNGSGSPRGITSSGSFSASHTSEMQGQPVTLEYPDGRSYDGFLFQGFTFEARALTTVNHTNSGTLRAESSSKAYGGTCVEFSVVGSPAGFSIESDLGPGTYVEFSGGPCEHDGEDFYRYYLNDVPRFGPGVVEDDLPRGGVLEPGGYRLCVGLTAQSRIATNAPAGGQPDDPDDKNRLLEFAFTVQ